MIEGATVSGNDLDRARDALQAIPPDLPRPDWVRVGMAAHAAGLSFEDFDAWSAGADCYEARAARDTWRSIKPGAGIGAGTLFRMAADHGAGRNGSHRRGCGKAPGRPAAPPKAPRPGMNPAEVWSRFKPAPADHPYITAKDGSPAGLRVVPDGDPLRIADTAVAGWLVVPVLPLGGSPDEPMSMQFIPPPGAGKKLNLPGAPMTGVFVTGDLLPGGTVRLCEGIGQAWACWKATGSAAVVCFGWSRVRAVAEELRQRDASAQLVLVPDVGKEDDAEAIARAVGAEVAPMPAGEPANFDANDYAQRDGLDALRKLLSSPQRPAQRFKLLAGTDLRAMPLPDWRIKDVLPAEGVGAIYGASGAGKSFLAIDMAVAIAEGQPWFGHPVKAAPVVYVPLEGRAGVRLRARAWEIRHGRKLPENLRFVLEPPLKLTDPNDVRDMAAAVRDAGRGAVTIIDTLNAAAPDSDENTSADMSRIVEATKALQRGTEGLVLLVHHSGKDSTKGLRGHSSLLAALDAAIEVSRDGDRRNWRLAKAKDGADGAVLSFRLDTVEIEQDGDGEIVTSCIVAETGPATPERAKGKKQRDPGANQRIVLDALAPQFQKEGVKGKVGAPAETPCLELEAAVVAAGSRLTCPPDRRTERARTAINGLVARGVLACNDGWIWRVQA